MRKLIVILLLSACYYSHAQQAYNISLLAHWNDSTLNHCDGDQIWSDITGWHDTTKNREYIITGSCDSLYFFDITDPTKVIKCDVEEGHSRNAVNRDFETYSHYVYCVSDRTSPPGSLQIFDLQYLPDSVHKVYDDDFFSINTHTIFIEAASKRLYLCGNTHKPAGNRSMAILSLEDPENPTYLGELSNGAECSYTHEVFVKNDTAFCSCGTPGLFIYDVRDATLPKLVDKIVPPYPYNGYNHSSWLDSSGKYIMFTDEVPHGLPIKIYERSNLNEPISIFNSNTGATPHNAFWKGNIGWASSYEDGVYAYDLSNPYQPQIAGYYDTYTKNATGVYNGFHGCWGVYPFLPSGNIIASDISEGLFVLKPSANLGVNAEVHNFISASVYPNPIENVLHFSIASQQKTIATVQITNMHGKLIAQKNIPLLIGENEFTFNDWIYTSGIYIIQIKTNTATWSSKFMKQ